MSPMPKHSSDVRAEAPVAERHARAAMQRLFELPAVDATRDGRLARSCFKAGIVDIGVSFALRAAGAFRDRDELEACERALAVAERYVRRMRPDAVERLAHERCVGGDSKSAAALLTAAAAQRLTWGDSGQALRLCHEAARCAEDRRGLHRTWALALLGAGDPDGGMAHLDRWREEEPDSLAAAAWGVEACRRARRSTELPLRFTQLRELAGSDAGHDLHARIRQHLARTGETIAMTPPPFWECEELEELPDLVPLQRRIWLRSDFLFADRALSSLLDAAGFEVVRGEYLTPGDRPIDLAIVPLGPAGVAAGILTSLRHTPGCETAPVLGVPTCALSTLDFAALLRLGVIGVLHPSMGAEHLVARVRQCVEHRGPERRLQARISVDLPLIVDDCGTKSEQRMDSLSCGGMRLRSQRVFEPNSELDLQFRLGGEGGDVIDVQGRVIYCRAAADGVAIYSVGIFFLELDESYRAWIEAEIARVMTEAADASPPVAA